MGDVRAAFREATAYFRRIDVVVNNRRAVAGASVSPGASHRASPRADPRRARAAPGVVETPLVEQVNHDAEFVALWPTSLNMPPSWVAGAVVASVRFGLVEVSVPPGAGTIEKLAALAFGVADTIVDRARTTSHWWATRQNGGDSA
jgi:hypothetical protein